MYPTVALWEAVLFLAGGLALLAWSADRFVEAAARVARRLGVSSFFIGVVLVGFGTSIPEFTVSTLAALGHHADLALANVYGSNTVNIAVILGIAALMRPLRLKRTLRFGVVPILLLTLAISWGIIYLTGGVSRMSGAFLVLAFVLLVPIVLKLEGARAGFAALEVGKVEPKGHGLLNLVVLLALIFAGAYLVVWGAVAGARQFGVSELVIGGTIIAIGTSLPELATTIAALKKHDAPLALGNILGSNLFNTLFIVGASAFMRPLTEASAPLLWRDLPAAIVMTALLMRKRLTRCWGICALAYYAIYAAIVIYTR